MTAYFKRQLVDYVEYHRDPRNCAMHVFGILFLFLAAVLPLSLWRIDTLGGGITAASIMVLPVLIYWCLLDAPIGAAIVGVALVLTLMPGSSNPSSKFFRLAACRMTFSRVRSSPHCLST